MIDTWLMEPMNVRPTRDIVLPTRTKDRNETEDPRLKKSRIEAPPAERTIERTEKELARCICFNNDTLPAHRALDVTERALPSRAHARIDNVLPRARKLHNDIPDPNLLGPRTDNEDPTLRKSTTENEAVARTRPRTEKLEPSVR
jgi:hypothetical protein